MAEPTDRPVSAAGTTPPPPPLRSELRPYPGTEDAPNLPPVGAQPALDYRPLSLAAVGGFGLAVLFAVFLTACWFVTVVGGTPLLMFAALLLWPIAALVMSALALVRIQQSEGTRAGRGLALVGMGVSVLFGLMYGAYYTASYVALRQQAEQVATEWLELIRDNRMDEAFRLMLDPDGRPPDADLHRNLELRFNVAEDDSGMGPLSQFRQSELVRFINHAIDKGAGAETTIKFLGVRDWSPEHGGYRVVLNYEIDSAEGEAQWRVAVQGTDKKDRGRQWAVLWKYTGPTGDFHQKPLRARVQELTGASSTFVHEWVGKLRSGDLEGAYLDTQDPARRPELRAEYRARLAAAGLGDVLLPADTAPLADADLGRRLFLPGYRDFVQGALVQARPDNFWAEGTLREEIPSEARKLFDRPQEWLANAMRPSRSNKAHWQVVDGRLRMTHDLQLALFPSHMVEGTLLVETDARALETGGQGQPAWRIVALDLRTGRSMGVMEGGMPGR